MYIRKVVVPAIVLAYLVLILALLASAATSETYRMDQSVFNNFGNTGTAASKLMFVSGGETTVGQVFGTSLSVQIGFFNNYFQAMPTYTPTGTITPTATITRTATISPTATNTPTITPTITITSTQVIPHKYFKLYNNLINPILGEKATIKWVQPQTGSVSITIYNLLGNKIITLVDQSYTEGEYHSVTWNGRNQYGQIVGSGIYVVLLKVAGYEDHGKVAVVK